MPGRCFHLPGILPLKYLNIPLRTVVCPTVSPYVEIMLHKYTMQESGDLSYRQPVKDCGVTVASAETSAAKNPAGQAIGCWIEELVRGRTSPFAAKIVDANCRERRCAATTGFETRPSSFSSPLAFPSG